MNQIQADYCTAKAALSFVQSEAQWYVKQRLSCEFVETEEQEEEYLLLCDEADEKFQVSAANCWLRQKEEALLAWAKERAIAAARKKNDREVLEFLFKHCGHNLTARARVIDLALRLRED
jgi:hypothetical protein